jgi:hypothetical protein
VGKVAGEGEFAEGAVEVLVLVVEPEAAAAWVTGGIMVIVVAAAAAAAAAAAGVHRALVESDGFTVGCYLAPVAVSDDCVAEIKVDQVAKLAENTRTAYDFIDSGYYWMAV